MVSFGDVKIMTAGKLSVDTVPETTCVNDFFASYLQPATGDFVFIRPGGSEAMSVGFDGALAFANYNKQTREEWDSKFATDMKGSMTEVEFLVGGTPTELFRGQALRRELLPIILAEFALSGRLSTDCGIIWLDDR